MEKHLMYQVVAICIDPTLISLLRNYCQRDNQHWSLRTFPTIGSYLAAPRLDSAIDLLFYDAQGISSGLEEKRLLCFMAPLALRVVVTNPEHGDVLLDHLSHFHSFVSRDLNYDHVKQLFGNAERLSQLTLSEAERRLIGQLTDYPVFPSICSELRTLLADPQVEIMAVSTLVERDPLIVSRLLQLVNSPYMGFASETWALHTAINRLGFQLLQTLVLMLSVKAQQEQLDQPEHSALIDQIMQDAASCRQLAKECALNRTLQDQVYITAILSGFGKLVLLKNGRVLEDLELQQALPDSGLTYLAVAAFLMTLWGFEASIVAGISQQSSWQQGSAAHQQVSNCLYLARLRQLDQLSQLTAAEKAAITAAGFAKALQT